MPSIAIWRLFSGVGIVLITVSGVAWRLTAHDAPSCRMMLGIGGGDEGGAEPNRRFVPRLPPSYGRPHHPYAGKKQPVTCDVCSARFSERQLTCYCVPCAAMMYPEFHYRPPPPSYQASMQDYRLRLLLLDRHPGSAAPGGHAVSPPPTYRSHSGSILRCAMGGGPSWTNPNICHFWKFQELSLTLRMNSWPVSGHQLPKEDFSSWFI
jgi:hypothetical protein